MKSKILTVILFIFFSCSTEEKTDRELLEIDKKVLLKSLDSYKITPYKFGKILLRASVEKDTISAEFNSYRKDINRLSKKLMSHNIKNPEKLSLLDYISLYRDYKNMESFIMKTDEDMFPPLLDVFNVIYGDSISKKRAYYKGKEKQLIENLEHTILSAIVILSKDLGKEISLYECSKTNPDLLQDSELKTLLQFFRGFLFFEKKLYYLSENEITKNINWLNENQNIDLPYTRSMFQWGNLENRKTHLGIHSLNHLFRGFNRLMMNREIDEERALKDFEIFLNDSKEIGLNNEIINSIEAYLYLKKEKNEKAIIALTKLKSGKLLSSKDKKRIDESISYLKSREPENVLNGFYDKYFLSKIATKYMFSKLNEVDWKTIMKKQKVPHTEEMFAVIDKFKEMTNNLNKYSTTETLKEVGGDVKEKGKEFFNKAKDLIN
ncbi:short-chain dehydrogenase [uncultured Tenacibaculum sp.]|uniref:short-chain dehydrogenase n=1 Tax=uncultured Tenacibaculum sp. TaxID=174713 RepID=UPI002631AB8E|nr:short-chain dehydrogenase [uncultured Tenacibaculum sp.]